MYAYGFSRGRRILHLAGARACASAHAAEVGNEEGRPRGLEFGRGEKGETRFNRVGRVEVVSFLHFS